MQVIEDLGKLRSLPGALADWQFRRYGDVQRAVERVGGAPTELEAHCVRIRLRRSIDIQVFAQLQAVAAELVESVNDLLARAVEQHAAADGDHVAKLQDAELH